MDGFLTSPYNVSAVQEVIHLALGVKQQRMRERIEGAARLILASFSDDLNFATHDAKYQGRELKLAKDIVDAMRIFASFDEEELAIYYEVLEETFSKVQPPIAFAHLIAAQEEGHAKRPSSKLVSKLRNALQDAHWRVRMAALKKIESFGPDADLLESELEKCLHDPSPECRQAAVNALSHRQSRGSAGARRLPTEAQRWTAQNHCI
jgi:hypothetical protein